MRVLIYGAGKFGRLIAESFGRNRDAFSDVVLIDPANRPIEEVLANVRITSRLNAEEPDIVLLTASAVPPAEREKLAESFEPIERFWELERQYNLALFRELLPWLAETRWRLLIIGTNPVHEWVNALLTLLPNRKIVGLGTAFDSRRIKYLAAAMFPLNDFSALNMLRVVGGHGLSIGLSGGKVPKEVFNVAKWMSNTLSVAFVNAPKEFSALWWDHVAIRPLVEGLSGAERHTHLVTPFTYGGLKAATGIDVQVKGLDVSPLPLDNVSTLEREELIAHLREMTTVGRRLAKQLG